MNVKMSLLSVAVLSGLAVSSSTGAAVNSRAATVARANALVAGPATQAVHRAKADSFSVRSARTDANGTQHVRYQRSFGGLPVIGGDFVLHTRSNGAVSVSQTLRTATRPALTPRISAADAIVEAGSRFGTRFVGTPGSRLVVFARGASPVLAHEVVYSGTKSDQTPTEMHYFVDARSGKVLDQWDAINTARPGPGGGSGCASPVAATGTGKSLTLGNVTINTTKCGSSYRMTDGTRGGGATHNMAMRTTGMGAVYTDSDNSWGNNQIMNSQTVAADAHYGVAMTWDYYKTAHGRSGIDNLGNGAISRVHYGRNYKNAFWSDACYCMTFGDGDNGVTVNPMIALDVAGHEMSHGVMAHEAALIYSGESGGLNEANSDINGTMVEFFTNNPQDKPDYIIGENVYAQNPDGTLGLRWMFKPSLDEASPDCYQPDIGTLDVHYSSGVANHFYYLLAEGAVVPAGFGAGTWANLSPSDLVCNGNTAIAGSGRSAAQKIWYKAVADYMTSDTDYAGARAATISAASDLYGPSSAQANAVKAAWSAVSVN